MEIYKGRKIDTTKPVKVHRNLHQQNYSIKQGGLVVAHANDFILQNCKFTVGKAGQARVRKTRQKNVHAHIQGILINEFEGIAATDGIALPEAIRYNPYVNEQFTAQPVGSLPRYINEAKVVIFNERGVTAKI